MSNNSNSYADRALSIVQSYVDENLNSQTISPPPISHRTHREKDKYPEIEDESILFNCSICVEYRKAKLFSKKMRDESRKRQQRNRTILGEDSK